MVSRGFALQLISLRGVYNDKLFRGRHLIGATPYARHHDKQTYINKASLIYLITN